MTNLVRVRLRLGVRGRVRDRDRVRARARVRERVRVVLDALGDVVASDGERLRVGVDIVPLW